MPVSALVLVVVVAVGIIVAAVASAWRHGTLHPTEQERIDMEFERIVGSIDAPTRRSGLADGSPGRPPGP